MRLDGWAVLLTSGRTTDLRCSGRNGLERPVLQAAEVRDRSPNSKFRANHKLQGQTRFPSRDGTKALSADGIRAKLASQAGNASRRASGRNCCLALEAQRPRKAELNARNASSRYCSFQKHRLVFTNFSG